MVNNIKIVLILVLLFFGKGFVFAQNDSIPKFRQAYIDEVIFPTIVKNEIEIGTQLNQGYRAFIIKKSSTFTQQDLTDIKAFISVHPRELIAFLFEENNGWEQKIKDYLEAHIILLSHNLLPLTETLEKNKKQILIFENKEIDKWVTYVKLGKFFPADYNNLYTKNVPTHTFTHFEYVPLYSHRDTQKKPIRISSLNQAVNAYLSRTGKFPNFILNQSPDSITKIKSTLPLTVRVDVKDSLGISLNNVRWKDNPLLISNGIAHLSSKSFSYKENSGRYTGTLNAVPFKEGYDFIPKMFSFNANTYDKFKTFRSRKLDIKKGLLFHLPLNPKESFSNIEVLQNNLRYKNDPEKGGYAYFKEIDNNLYFQTRSKADFDALSVSFWMNPEKITENRAVLSAAESVVFKIRKEKICLTFPNIKDVISNDLVITPNQWQHIAITCTNNNTVKFYKNGNLVEVIPINDYLKTFNNSFVLGSDQWEEFYFGGIKDVAFWNRAISPEEVKTVFKHSVPSKNIEGSGNIWLWILLGSAFLFGIVLLTKRRNKHKKKTVLSNDTIGITKVESSQIQVNCFGKFEILDLSGKNVLVELSLKKKIFLFVILYHTLKDGGISPSKLSDILWPGYSPKRAKNIRSTYLQAIRTAIADDTLKIIYADKKWAITINKGVVVDLGTYFKLHDKLKSLTDIEAVQGINFIDIYLDIIKKGTLIADIQSEIVDNYKNTIHTEVIETLERLLNHDYKKPNPDLIYKITSAIFIFDATNEDALRHKLSILSKTDKNKARKCFEQFSKCWEAFYGEPYSPDSSISKLI